MPFCPKCGEEVGQKDKFCRSCGERFGEEQDSVAPREGLRKKEGIYSWRIILAFITMEVAAIIGGLPLITVSGYRYVNPGKLHLPGSPKETYTVMNALWDYNGALAGFLVASAIIVIFLTRKSTRKIQVISTVAVVCVLLGTALGVRALN